MRTWKIGLGRTGWDTKWYTVSAFTFDEALNQVLLTQPQGGWTGNIYYEELT